MMGEACASTERNFGDYHDTITMVFVRLIAVRLCPAEDFPSFRARNPDLFDRTFPALLKHYTPERLYSAEAKLGFVEPDLEPLLPVVAES
jgi:hypothetical protein